MSVAATLAELKCSIVPGIRFYPPSDGVEDLEYYEPGGYHPICIDDTFDDGRYRILHKLGHGGFSTVWLARDQWEGNDQGKIVALKAMCSDVSSSEPPTEVCDVAISKKLKTLFPKSVHFLTVERHFLVQGPNGTHVFFVCSLAGPNIRSFVGSYVRRLRADLSRKFAKQVAMALYDMHNADIVHGDLTASNILFRLSPHVIQWSDAEVYAYFGNPKIREVRTCSGEPLGPHVPPVFVLPIPPSKISAASLLQESIVINDFGQSYIVSSPPPSYAPGTAVNYCSPEIHFENRAGFEADIWALACAIFEIVAGYPLFETFLSGLPHVLPQIVEVLGRLPDPWWEAFEQRDMFDEDGRLRSESPDSSSLREKLLMIGHRGRRPPLKDEGPMIEKSDGLSEEEIDLLEDLLKKMLKYLPEDRISIQEVIEHPWFML